MNINQLNLIDAHCHINFSAYKDDAPEVIRRSIEQGIGMFVVGSQAATSQRAVEYANRYEEIWAIIGLHPIHLFEQQIDETEAGGELAHFRSRAEKFTVDFYRQLARSTQKVIAIGECGLDYYHLPADVDRNEFCQRQETVFRALIELALELSVPVMIHSRDAADGSTNVHADIRAILKEYIDAGRPLKGNVHCFSGKIIDMQKYLELGMYISFTGNLTYKPRRIDLECGETLWDVAQATPLDRVLVETDAPYLSPVPHRGERNEPVYVKLVAEKLAEIKNLPIEKVERQIMENIHNLFGNI
jgi:TatD DNase family protein